MSQNTPAADDDAFVILEAETDGLPDVWIINTGLEELPGKGEFPWHLSIIVEMQESFENGLPTKEEQEVLGNFGEKIGTRLKADGNAVWVANVTWGSTRQFVYRVRDPEVANVFLSTLLEGEAAIRPLEYEMEEDAGWEHAATYIESARVARQMREGATEQ